MKRTEPTIDHDQLFKELLTTFFVEFLDLFFPELAALVDRESVVFLDKELLPGGLRRRKRQVDIVAKVNFRLPSAEAIVPSTGMFLIHVENQAAKQADFERRMFRYWARLFERHDAPIYPIALFSYDAPLQPEMDRFIVRFPDIDVLDFHFRAIQLNRLSWRTYAAQKNPVASALMAKMTIAPEDRWRVKLECLRLLGTLRLDRDRMQLISGFVDTYLTLNEAEEALFVQAVQSETLDDREGIMEIETSWMRKGRELGRQEGMQQGMQQVVLLLLQQRFNGVSQSATIHIQELTPLQISDLAVALLNFTRPSDLDGWLAARVA